MKRILALAALAAVLCANSGCAVCKRHPDGCKVAFAIGSGLVIGGLAATEWHGGGCIQGCNHRFQTPEVKVK